MATQIIIARGEARAVYDDRWRVILEALGTMDVQRASEVEYDPKSGDWIAWSLADGHIIARGRDRGAVIRAEVAYLEATPEGET